MKFLSHFTQCLRQGLRRPPRFFPRSGNSVSFSALVFNLVVCTGLRTIPALGAEKTGTAVDELMERLGGAVPYPPERIIDILQAQGIEVFGGAVVPHGRSLERRSTSYAQPRTMVSFYLGKRNELGQPQDPSKFVFIAHTPALQQLEVIGASPTLPQGFFLVTDYRAGNLAARPLKPRQGPGLCLTCHQNGGPIFPMMGWNETNNNPKVIEKLKIAENLDSFALRVLGVAENRGGGVLNKAVADFDRSVRIAAHDSVQLNEMPADRRLPSSYLQDRDPVGREREFRAGVWSDPLVPRPNALVPSPDDSPEDLYARPSSKWTISLSRDGQATLDEVPVKTLFIVYCGSCHLGAGAIAPPLPLRDLEALKTYRGAAGRTVRDLLIDRLMPPMGEPLLSPQDRLRMIQKVKKVGGT